MTLLLQMLEIRIVKIIQDVLLRLNISLNECRGQCYDGASVMQGIRSGVATQILKLQPKALYTHCYGHSLNLACQDMVRNIKQLRDALESTHELSKLLKYSAKRKAEYLRLQHEISPSQPGFCNLRPTRWTVRASSLQSVLDNFDVLQQSLESLAEMSSRDPEMSARCAGLIAQFSSFSFLFGVFLGSRLFSLADNLSTSLQSKKLSAAEAQELACLTIRSLQQLRSDASFQSFWSDLEKEREQLDINLPNPPRRRKRPSRFEDGNATPHFPCSAEEHFRAIYFEAVDTISSCI
jgi:hypothetical protein